MVTLATLRVRERPGNGRRTTRTSTRGATMIALYKSLLSRPQVSSGTLTAPCGDIPNAESLVLDDSQRPFGRGREGVYELLASPDDSCATQFVSVAVPGVRMPCMSNGLAAHGDYLYLACADVYQTGHPLLQALLVQAIP